MKNLRVLAIIPARGGSKSIKDKNIVDLNGKPLIYYTIKAAKDAKCITDIIVTSDSNKILNIAKKYGAEIIKRPKEIATDISTTEEAMQHVYENIDFMPDIIILLQPTCPLRTGKHIDEAYKKLTEEYNSVLSVCEEFHNFRWKQDKVEGRYYFMPTNYNPDERPRRQDLPKTYLENGAIFIIRANAFRKIECRLAHQVNFYEMSKYDSIDIDTQEDLDFIRKITKVLNTS